MGSCFSEKGFVDGRHSEFHRDIPINKNTYKPLKTTLYNILRKPKQLQIIRQSSGSAIVTGQTNPNLSKIKTNQIKMLYNFKNIIAIDEIPSSLEVLNQLVNLKAIYQINSKFAKEFVDEYPIFEAKQNPQKTSTIPLLLFRGSQIISPKGNPDKQIFLHSKKFRNDKIYEKLKIRDIVEDGEDPKTQKPRDVVKQLKNSTAEKVLFLHSDKINQTDILNILSEYVKEKYQTSIMNTKIYLRRFLPNTSLSNEVQIMASMIAANQKQKQPEEKTIAEKYFHYLKKLQNQSSKQKTQRAYHLLITLLSNIYSNREEEHYRKVRKSNKNIHEVLGKYKYGVKLLDEVGFRDEDGYYVNTVESKFLKVFRTDLDLAFKRFCSNK